MDEQATITHPPYRITWHHRIAHLLLLPSPLYVGVQEQLGGANILFYYNFYVFTFFTSHS